MILNVVNYFKKDLINKPHEGCFIKTIGHKIIYKKITKAQLIGFVIVIIKGTLMITRVHCDMFSFLGQESYLSIF